jgi:hypothetical protein
VIDLWDGLEEWTPEHSKGLQAFMNGPVGKVLALHLRKCSFELNSRAVQSGDMHECDRAGGFQYALAYLDSLSAPKGEPQSPIADEDSPEGVEDYLERMTP